MQKTRIIVFLLIAILLISFVSARSWYMIRTPERMRHIYFDPIYTKLTSDTKYTKPLAGFGIKDATGSRGWGDSGFKSAEAMPSNLPYNSYIKRGRDPSHISNWDPQMRGYSIMNVHVELDHVDDALYAEQGILKFPGNPSGSARIISNRQKAGEMYDTTIYLRTQDMYGLEQNEVFEAWLVDIDTEYPLSLGLFTPTSYKRTGTLNFEMTHYVHNYDLVMVTKEPFPDGDPSPGEVVLIGEIPSIREQQIPISELSYIT